MRLFFPVVAVFFLGMLWAGCDVINPEEKVPTYLHIDSFQFVPSANVGTSSHNIPVAWVYLDNKAVGAFELPATVPLMLSQRGQVTVVPGISYDGLKDIKTSYPYYRSDTITLDPSPANVINFIPKTGYFHDSSFYVHEEDFENGNSFIKYDGDTTVIRTSDPAYVFEGSHSGYIYLKAPQTFAESISNIAFTVGPAPFLEMDYKCSVPFGVGLQAITSDNQSVVQYILTLKPKSDWNKVYIGLQDVVTIYPNLSYRIMIKAILDNQSEGYIAIDNLKVISSR